MAMNLRRKKKKPTSTQHNNEDSFYDTNYNDTTNNDQQSTNNTYYDDTQDQWNDQTYDDQQNYDQSYDNNQSYDDTQDQQWDDQNWQDTPANTAQNTQNTDYYYEPEPEPEPQPQTTKPSRFVRPRPKHRTKPNTSFTPQQSKPTTSQSQSQSQPKFKPNRPNQTQSRFTQDWQQLAQAGLSSVVGGGSMGQIGANLLTDKVTQNLNKYVGDLSWYQLKYYKYYFRVDNQYVLKKLTRILFPFLKMSIKQWKRKRIDEVSEDNTAPPPNLGLNGNYDFQSPMYDINAPDGYLPLMAVVTYVVIMGFVVGYQSNEGSAFSPQILIATGSSACVMLIIEVLLMKFGFYLIGNVSNAPYWLDIVCYTGYKLVFVTINLVIYLLFNSQLLYYCVSIGTGLIAALFMVQSLRPYFRDLSEFSHGSGQLHMGNGVNGVSSNEPKKTRKIFLGVVGIAQILFIQFMGKYTSI